MSDRTLGSECCKRGATVKRTLSPALAVSRTNVYDAPLYLFKNRQKTVEYKCMMAKDLSYPDVAAIGLEGKAGIISTDDPLGRATQTLGSALIPGNLSKLRNPIRSTLGSALATGPRGLLPSTASRLSLGMTPKPDRGFRCPEGFQFGGQFTDKYYSTCGKKLFQIALSLGANFERYLSPTLSSALRRMALRGYGGSARLNVGQALVSDQISTIRDPRIDIPNVGSFNSSKFAEAIKQVVADMTDSGSQNSRLVRRDGLVLEPLVSPKVLKTVPDNKSMEGAAYVSYADLPGKIGGDEMGMFSNSGVVSIMYVLPNGGTLALRKKRNLSNGERRKLGRTISDARSMDMRDNPAKRLEYVASEMDGPIAYEQNFPGLEYPNDVVTVSDGKTGKTKQVRKWHRDAYLLGEKRRMVSERETQVENQSGMTEDLDQAVMILSSGGEIGEISPEIRIPAMDRSKLFSSKKINNRATEYYAGEDRFVVVSPSLQFEHIGAMVSAEIQSQLGAVAPYVWFAGSGTRRPYIFSMPNGSRDATRTSRVGDRDLADPEDMARLMVSDFLTDSLSRNPSLVYTSQLGGKTRTFASPLVSSAMSGMSRKQITDRIAAADDELIEELIGSIYSDYFREIREAQKKRALTLIEELLERARMFSFEDFARRMAIDGGMSEVERTHAEKVKLLYSNRVEALYRNIKNLRTIIGG